MSTRALVAVLFLVSAGVGHALEPTVITAPEAPPEITVMALEEVWRLVGDDPDAPLLGVPSGAVVTDDGHVLILDRQLAHVLEFSADGEYLATLGREGEGPGELLRPQGMLLFSAGGIGLLQSFPAKIERLSRDGTPLGAIAGTESRNFWWRAQEAAGVTVVLGQSRRQSESSVSQWITTHYVASVSADGEIATTYLEKITTEDFSRPHHDEAEAYFPGHVWSLCRDGVLVCAPDRDDYRLEFRSPRGDVLKVVERPFAARVRNEEDLEDLKQSVTYTRGGEVLEVETRFLPTEPAITGIQVLDDGAIWVTSCFGNRDLPAGVFRRFDVFESDGSFRGEVHIAYAYDEDRDSLALLHDGSFVHTRNIVGAWKAMSRGLGPAADADEIDEADDEDIVLEVIRLRRAG